VPILPFPINKLKLRFCPFSFVENGKPDLLPFSTDIIAPAEVQFWPGYGSFLHIAPNGLSATVTPCTVSATCNSQALCHYYCDVANTGSCQAAAICPISTSKCSVFTPSSCCAPNDVTCIEGPQSKLGGGTDSGGADVTIIVPWVVAGFLALVLIIAIVVLVIKKRGI